jgi:TetR/AcrR family transcriptional regulator, transcriptional repressor for nem operon
VKPACRATALAVTFVSLAYGAMLAARAYGNAALFRDVTGGAVERLAVPRKRA